MRALITATTLALAVFFAVAQARAETLGAAALRQVILPGYSAFAQEARALESAAARCEAAAVRNAYHAAFDAWLRIEPIAFGPIESSDRRFAIVFWPDPKGFVAKSLSRLTRAEDPIVSDKTAFSEISVAARGFPALERVLWDDKGPRSFKAEGGPYRCRVAQAIAAELSRNAAQTEIEWRASDGISAELADPKEGARRFRNEADVARALFTSLDGAIEKNAALRIGRPLGKFGRERPRRAETWRSGRDVRNIRVSIEALETLYASVFAQRLSEKERKRVSTAFALTREALDRAPDSFKAAQGDPSKRIRFEAAQSRINGMQRLLREVVAPAYGVTLGFNSLDGD